MSQITSEFLTEFITRNAPVLRCIQPKLCVPIIDRLYRKMLLGIKFPEIKLDADLICDGHHRYLASLISRKNILTTPSIRTSSTRAIDWTSVLFDEDDWDTTAKINSLNQQDADFNNIPFDEFVVLLSKV